MEKSFWRHGIKSVKIKNKKVDRRLTQDVAPENVKIRVTTYVSEDIINWLKAEGEKRGVGYQTFLDSLLRDTMKDRTKTTAAIEAMMSNKFLAKCLGEAPYKLTAYIAAIATPSFHRQPTFCKKITPIWPK